jgi:hypothetical protein
LLEGFVRICCGAALSRSPPNGRICDPGLPATRWTSGPVDRFNTEDLRRWDSLSASLGRWRPVIAADSAGQIGYTVGVPYPSTSITSLSTVLVRAAPVPENAL